MGRVQWVLSRPLYRFGHFDLKTVPAGQRARALAMQVRQWSPYTATGTYTSWHDGEAMVWAWDSEKLSASVVAHDLAPAKVQVIPETLLHSAAQGGARLQSCIDGFEAQLWRDGLLVASRWWPRMPQAREWRAFERDAGLGPDEQSEGVPPSAEPGWLESPWARNELAGDRPAVVDRNERVAITAGVIALSLVTSWYGVSLAKVGLAQSALSRELRELQGQARPIQQARNQALDALARTSSLQSVMAYPDQLSVMAKAAERLAPTGATLKEWEYRAGKLKVTFAVGAKATSSDYVKAFQQEGIFENVQAVPAAGQGPAGGELLFALTMDVKPRANIAFEPPRRAASSR